MPTRATGQVATVGGSCHARAMTAMTMRQWTDADTTWFAISGVGSELAAPAERVLMDYQRNGGEWRRGYRADTITRKPRPEMLSS